MAITVAAGTTIKQGSTAIGKLTSIGGLEISADTIDTTALDTVGGYRTFVQGWKDGGEVSLEGFFDKDTGQSALLTSFGSGASATYTITFPTGGNTTAGNWSFSGIVTKLSTSAGLEDAVSFAATLKVSGAPTLTFPV